MIFTSINFLRRNALTFSHFPGSSAVRGCRGVRLEMYPAGLLLNTIVRFRRGGAGTWGRSGGLKRPFGACIGSGLNGNGNMRVSVKKKKHEN